MSAGPADLDAAEPAPPARSARQRELLGASLALLTIVIWAGWFISTRFLVNLSLAPSDIAALRFGVSGLIFLPVAIRDWHVIRGVEPWRWAVLATGAGAPYVLTIAAGLSFAPAAHAAALTPGVMPLFVAVLSAALLREQIGAARWRGFALVLAGLVCIAGAGLLSGLPGEWRGHLLFVLGAFIWACYTIALRGSGLSALQAAALVSVTSLLIYTPVYLGMRGAALATAPLADVLLGAVYQGVLTGALSLFTFAKAVELLGASRAAAFASLIPVLTLIASVPLLGEQPGLFDVAGISAISLGVYLASGIRRTPRASG